MSSTGSRHCTAAVDSDDPEPQQNNGTSVDHAQLNQASPSSQLPSLSFNPDAAPFVFNPRGPRLNLNPLGNGSDFNPDAAPFNPIFNPLSNGSASTATRPHADFSPRAQPLSPNCQPFSPRVTAPLAEPHSSMYSFDQPALTYSWDGAGSNHAYLDNSAAGSGNLTHIGQLAQMAEVQRELNAATHDAVHQAISEAAQDVLDSVGTRTTTRPPATRGLSLTQSALCQQALQHDQAMHHEHVVTRVRTAVHAEVVRALQRLTALPLSGQLVHSTKKSSSSNNTTSASHTSNDAASPRKRKKLPPHTVSNGKSESVAADSARSSEATGAGEYRNGKEGSVPAVVFMDKSSARAHADAITSHTYKAFQRVDGSTAQTDMVAVNYCKAIMVDILATAASWRMWVCDQSVQKSGAREMLESEHSKSLDTVHSAVPSAQNTFKQLDFPDDDSDSNEESSDRGAPFSTAPGPARAAAHLQNMSGIHGEPLSVVPWASSAGKPGYFLKQTRKAVLRLLQCAAEAGPSLMLVAAGQFLSDFRGRARPYHRASHTLPLADTPNECASSAGYSAASLDGQEELLGNSIAQQPDQHTPEGNLSQWDDDQASDGPQPLAQAVTERELEEAEPFDVVSGAQAGSSVQLRRDDSDEDHGDQGDSGTLWPPSRVRVPHRHTDIDDDAGPRHLRVAPREPRRCLSPHAVPPASVSFASLVSPHATPRGRQPWSRHKEEIRGRKPGILGVLEPQHPLLKPVIVREPGVALGCALPNEANQHLTLTQQDGSEPLWRAGVYSSEVAQRGLHVDTILDSRVAYVHCIIGPPSCMTAMNPGMAPVQTAARWRNTTGKSTARTQQKTPAELAGSSALDAAVQYAHSDTDGLVAGLGKTTAHINDSTDTVEGSVMISAWALAGVCINGRRIEHNEYDELCNGDRLTLVPHSTVGPALNYVFKAGDPTMALIPPSASAAALLPPLHSVPLCQICGDLPHECLELQPCGHTFCAVCLSHRFAAVLTSGAHLTCPHGCPRPDNIDRCMEVDMLVASLPEYLPRLARVIEWRPQGRPEASTGDAATPRAPGSMPRSPNWGGAFHGCASAESPLRRGGTPLHAIDSHGSAGDAESVASPFERFVESLGPNVWPNTPHRAAATTPTHTHMPLTSSQRSASILHDSSRAQDHETVAPPLLNSPANLSAPFPEPSSASAAVPMRPVSISELVPLSKEMTPLPMQELYAQQADVSSRVIKVAANSNCEVADLRQLVRHFYVIAHATMAGPLWKDELNRSGTVEDAAAVVRAIVTAAKQGDRSPDSMGGRAGQQVLCAAASMICALVLAQLPGSEEVCQGNQWRAARAQVVEALVGALEAWPHSHLTCHATLQCLVALCKDNAMMKANMTVTALKPVLQVLHTCGSCSAIAERGFTLLAVLQAGGDHLNDGIRRLLIENGLQRASIRALQAHCGGDERALTAVCFAVAMILRGGERWRENIKWRAARSALPRTIFTADRAYRQRCTSLGIPQDEALAALLAFLVLYLEPVQKRMRSRRQLVKHALEWTGAASLTTAVVAIGCRMVGARRA